MTPLPSTMNRTLLASIVLGGAIMGLAIGTRHVQGLFLVPMTMERGWTREAFSFAMALQNLVWGLAQPFTGMLADRHGSARVVAAGVVLYAAGLALMACATTPLQLALAAGVLLGLALSCTGFGVVYAAVSRIAPPASRSSAVGLTGAVGGFALFLLVPLTQALQDALGWAAALLVLAGALLAVLPGARALDDRQDGHGGGPALPRQSLREAIAEAGRHRGFWLLNLGFLACGFQLAFIAAHLPAYLLDKGLHPRHAVVGLALVGLTNILGTYLCGHLGGLYRRKHLLAALYLARTVFMALFLLLPLTPASVYLFCAAMGLLWLGTVPLTSGIVAGVFGVRYMATLFGFVFFGHQVGGFFGAWLGGRVFDLTGSYEGVWIGAMVLGLVAAVLHLAIDDQPVARALRPRPA